MNQSFIITQPSIVLPADVSSSSSRGAASSAQGVIIGIGIGIVILMLFTLVSLTMLIVTDFIHRKVVLQTISAVPARNINYTLVGDYKLDLTLRDYGDSDCTAQISASGFNGNTEFQ